MVLPDPPSIKEVGRAVVTGLGIDLDRSASQREGTDSPDQEGDGDLGFGAAAVIADQALVEAAREKDPVGRRQQSRLRKALREARMGRSDP
jgi:hypothetical protein